MLSVIVVALLLCGYVGQFGLELGYAGAGRNSTVRSFEPVLDEGRARCIYTCQNPAPPAMPVGYYIGWTARFIPIRGLSVHRWLWGFDAHPSTYPVANSLIAAFIVGCPIWCLVLLCLILPCLWLRRRRKGEVRGFPVIRAENPPQ
jgi:hypothetical protein